MKKLILIAIAVALMACKKEDPKHLSQELIGTYQWQGGSTVGQITNTYTITLDKASECTVKVGIQTIQTLYYFRGDVDNFDLDVLIWSKEYKDNYMFKNCHFDNNGSIIASWGGSIQTILTKVD